MVLITLDFDNGARYSFPSSNEYLVPGSWSAPYSVAEGDDQAYSLLEAWFQSPESPVYGLIVAHGEPTQVTIASFDPSQREGVYKFHWDCGRMGELDGLFIATATEVDDLLGKEVYFGEVLGKHSDIYGTIDAGEVVLVTDDPAVVEVFRKNKVSSGHNPFHYLEG